MMIALLLIQVERGTTETLALKSRDLGADAARYEITDKTFDWEMTFVRERPFYSEYALTFPSPIKSGIAENDVVRAKYWRPRGRGPFPAVVVLHWLAGNFGALETFSTRLAEDGVAALMIWMPHYGQRRVDGRRMIVPDIDQTLANCLQASADARRAGHWLHGRAEIDRVGILGISLGSFIAAGTAGLDDQFEFIVPVIGGGDLASVLMNDSSEVRAVKERLQKEGFTLDSLREKLRPIDPVTWAARVPKERVLMINMEEDEIVPRAATEALWKAYGEPTIKWYPGGHYHVAMQFGEIVWDVVTFVRPKRWY